MQHHDPRRDANEDRSPERHQHEDHQHVRLARRQGRQPVRERVAEQQAPQRDDAADLEGAKEDAAEHALIARHALDVAVRIAAQVDRCEQVIAGPARCVLRDRMPVLGVAPAIVERDQLRLHIGRCRRAFERQRAVGVHHQRASAGDFRIEPACQRAGVGAIGQRSEVGGDRSERVGRRRLLAVPALQRDDGARQRVGDLGVLHRALEQRGDGNEEGQHQEQQQRQRQRERPQLAHAVGARQGTLQRARVGDAGDWEGGGVHRGVKENPFGLSLYFRSS